MKKVVNMVLISSVNHLKNDFCQKKITIHPKRLSLKKLFKGSGF